MLKLESPWYRNEMFVNFFASLLRLEYMRLKSVMLINGTQFVPSTNETRDIGLSGTFPVHFVSVTILDSWKSHPF